MVATGSEPATPPSFRALGPALCHSADVFEWRDLPESVAVIGAGVIGLELGQALSRLGVRVQILGKGGSIGQLTDPETLSAARATLAETTPLTPDHELIDARPEASGARLRWREGGEEREAWFERVLVATGRAAALDGLALDRSGAELGDDGAPSIDPETAQSGGAPVFFAGDADGTPPLLHIAAEAGRRAGRNAARWPEVSREARAPFLSVTFTDPQIATAGESRADLEARGADFETGAVDWSDQGRARAFSVNRGVLRVYADRASGRLLGAEMVGPAAEHLAHLLAWSLAEKATVSELCGRPFYHPCFEEGLRTALRAVEHAIGRGGEPEARSLECGPGG